MPPDATSSGYWNVLEVHAPRRFLVEDGFADDMGMEEGLRAAMGQIDDVLAEPIHR